MQPQDAKDARKVMVQSVPPPGLHMQVDPAHAAAPSQGAAD